MLKFTFIIFGDINQTSGGYYYDRKFIEAIRKRGHTVNIADARSDDLYINKTDIYIIDELCHPEFYNKSGFSRLKEGAPVAGMVHHLAVDEDINLLSKLYHLHMERGFFNRIGFAIFNSNSTRDSTLQKGGYNGASAIAVPGREDKISGNNHTLSSNSKLSLVFLGNIIPRKCLHHVIRHLSKISDIPYTMIIAGSSTVDSSYTRTLKKLISRHNLEKKIELIGYVNELEKKKLLGSSDILLMPSSHEGYGIAYIEAMGFGLIPVAGISGGASEIIRNGENGFLIDPADSRQLRMILESIWREPGLKKELSAAATDSWLAHPVWSQTFDKAIDCLEKLV